MVSQSPGTHTRTGASMFGPKARPVSDRRRCRGSTHRYRHRRAPRGLPCHVAMIDLAWPLRSSGVLGGAGVVLYVVVILSTVPLGWALLRFRVGVSAAGPLWLLLAFEVIACAYALLTPPWQTPDEPHHMLTVALGRRVE